jgi:hypothetical protein
VSSVRAAVSRPAPIHRPLLARAVVSAAVLASSALLLAACGSSGGSDSAAASAGGGGNGQGGEFQAYTQCLEQNGYTPSARPSGSTGRRSGYPSGRPSGFPSGRPSGLPSGFPSGMPTGQFSGRPGGGRGGYMGNTADPAYQKAAKSCESLRPTFGGGQGQGYGNGGSAASNGSADQSAVLAFASCMKDKGITVRTGSGSPLAGLSTADAKTAAALKTCSPLLPATGSGASPSASPNG